MGHGVGSVKQAIFSAVALFFGFFAMQNGAKAQERDFQTWSMVATRADFSNKLSLWMDNHVRQGPDSTLMILRPALGYRPTPWATAWAGYGWFPRYFEDGSQASRHEHRTWQQLSLHLSEPTFVLASRSRFEQRLFHTSSQVGLRARELIRGMARLSNTFWAVVTDEVLWQLNTTDWGLQSGFDQNRLFLGIAYLPNPHLRIEVGYLNVIVPRKAITTTSHVLSLNAFLRF